MRSYPHNSPSAAARIVALTMLADGHLSPQELEVLSRLGVRDRLGLSTDELQRVLHALCEDLLSTAHLSWSDACRIGPETLAAMMAEIKDPALRQKVLDLCVAVARADGRVAEGEHIVLRAAVEQWGLPQHLN